MILTLLAAVLLAQTPAQTATAPAASTATATAPTAGLTGEVKQVLDRAVAAYTSARSYQDKVVVELEVEFEGPAPAGVPGPQTIHLAFSRPNKLALRAPEYSVFCDGKTLWQYLVGLEDYVESPAPPKVDLAALQLNRFGALDSTINPVAALLTGTMTSPDALFGRVLGYTGVKAETRGGVAGKTISGIADWGGGEGGAAVQVPFTGWFDDAKGLLREIIFDRTEIMRQRMSGSPVQVKKDRQHHRFEGVTVNEPIAADSFVFKPGQYDRKVTELEPAQPDAYQARLHGRPTPDFKTKDLEGKPFNLASTKGKVVLLDLWSLNCRPCLMVMPKIQELATKYAKEPVEVIGVNSDPSGAYDQVKTWLKDNKITYRQIADENGEIAKFFRTIGIPYAILLDKEGTVRATHAGYRPTTPATLDDQLSRLLKGQPLPTQPADEGPAMTAPLPGAAGGQPGQ